jgi:hypothetical protein
VTYEGSPTDNHLPGEVDEMKARHFAEDVVEELHRPS